MDQTQGVIVGAILAGGLGTVAALGSALITTRHQRKSAREERVYDRKASVYVDLVTMTRDMVIRMQFITRQLDEREEGYSPPAAFPSDQELSNLRARLTAYGSQEICRLTDELLHLYRDWKTGSEGTMHEVDRHLYAASERLDRKVTEELQRK